MPAPGGRNWRRSTSSWWIPSTHGQHSWSTLKQQWYQAKSRELSAELHERLSELEVESLRQRYRLLKIELAGKRRSWRALLDTFTALPCQTA